MNAGYLLDTNILSKFTSKQPPPDILINWMSQRLQPFYISAINYYEIVAGLRAIRSTHVLKEFQNFLKDADIKVLPVTDEVIEKATIVYAESKLVGRKHTTADALIAATALIHNLTLATHDKDFADEIELNVVWPLKP